MDLAYLAAQTDNCSGSDIREIVRLAGQRRKKEVFAQAEQKLAEERTRLTDLMAKIAVPSSNGQLRTPQPTLTNLDLSVRALCMDDFLFALTKRDSAGLYLPQIFVAYLFFQNFPFRTKREGSD